MAACAALTTPRVTAPARPQRPPLQVAGGYMTVPLVQPAMAWWCYSKGHISFHELRCWWATLLAAKARSFGGDKGRIARYTVAEIEANAGGGLKRTLAALANLNRVGLVRYAEDECRYPKSAESLVLPDRDGLDEFLAKFPSTGRNLIVPRPVARLIATCRRPAMVATVLGLLTHCLYARDRKEDGFGRCKAGWVAATFNVAIRQVKESRAELKEMGLIESRDADQLALNRWGAAQRINLEWEPLCGPSAVHESAPLPPSGRYTNPHPSPPSAVHESAPPDLLPEPSLTGVKYQNPGADPRTPKTRTGVSLGDGGRGTGKTPHPGGWHIEVEDLYDDDKLMAKFDDGVFRGLLKDCPGDRVWFFAASARALELGGDPPAFLAGLIRGKLRGHATQGQEETAREKLRLYDDARRPPLPAPHIPIGPPSRPTLHVDAMRVRKVRGELGTLDRDKVFYQLRRRDPEWTRPRYDAAVIELDHPKDVGPRMTATIGDGGGLGAFGAILGFGGRAKPGGG